MRSTQVTRQLPSGNLPSNCQMKSAHRPAQSGRRRVARGERSGGTMILFPALPVRNRNIAAVFVQKAFGDEECEQIRAGCADAAWEEGMVGGHRSAGQFAVAPERRHVLQQRLPVGNAGYPLNRLCLAVSNANAEYWNFDLTGFVADDPPWVMKYTADRHDHYDWHIDVGQSVNASRKLGFTLQLSAGDEYE